MDMIRRLMKLSVGVLLLGIGCASCASQSVEQIQRQEWEESKRICYSCWGIYDQKCQEPTFSAYYLGKDPEEICPP